MNIFRKVAPAAALLAMTIVVPAPAAQSMTLKNNSGGTTEKKILTLNMSALIVQKPEVQTKVINKKTIKKRVIASNGYLSTNTSPTLIKTLVRRAWYNKEFKWNNKTQWNCYNNIIMHESSWNPWATNGRGWEETGGIPQAHPSRKMASEGKDYRKNVWTQVKWGLKYIYSVYRSPCNAWGRWQGRAGNGSYGWY